MESNTRHIIPSTAPIKEALRMLNELSGDVMTLIAVDNDRVVGTLTDGDVRRALLRGLTLDSPVAEAMHRDFRCLEAHNIDVEKLRLYRDRGIALIPVVNADGTLQRLIDTRFTHTILPLTAILMAGGKGERLRPLTLDCPKPLLTIGDKAIIDYNIDRLAASGITDVTVITNYLAPLIEEHFTRPVAGIQVKCCREPMFMGTIGAASLLPHTEGGNTLIMNSDLLTTISLEDMYLTHCREKADITIATTPYNVSVPYAILATEGRRVVALQEKPSYTYHANAGIYIVANELLRALPRDERTDATDLIERAIADGLRVVYHPINGTWIDIGSPADFARARELVELSRSVGTSR